MLIRDRRYPREATARTKAWRSLPAFVAAMLGFGLAAPGPLSAQAAVDPAEISVDREAEHQLRLLQAHGAVPAYPWSVRGLGPAEIEALLPPDTLARGWVYPSVRRPEASPGLRFAWIQPEAQLIHNTGFPYGFNDGPIWAGRGFTTAARAGFALRTGPVSLVLAPVAFYSQDAEFPLGRHANSATRPFADHRRPHNIDLPQRFAEGGFARVDPGQSTLRIDGLGLTAGVSTATQRWGPMRDHQLLMGDHAPGFAHAFLGTARPVDIWIGTAHGRLIWGRLGQSEHSPMTAGSGDRFLSGGIGVFSPRGVDGLEVGLARLFHNSMSIADVGLEQVLQPFDGVFARQTGNTPYNQLASVFARWVFAESGFEIYGEHVRRDYSYNLRDFLLNPDLNTGNAFGFQKSWEDGARLFALRGEVVHAHSAPGSPRGFNPMYLHSRVRQGHTHRGQLLGSPFAFYGSGMILAADFYHETGRWTGFWSRQLRQDGAGTAANPSLAVDVIHSLGVEARLLVRGIDLTAGTTAAYNFNRYLESDAFNLNVHLRVRPPLAW